MGLFLEKGKISKTMGHTESSVETPLCVALCSWLTAVDSPELIKFYIQGNLILGHDMAQVVSCRLLAAKSQPLFEVCGGQSGTERFFAEYCGSPLLV